MSRVTVTSVSSWAEACSAAFVPLRVRSAEPTFRASLRQQVLSPDVALTRVASGASEVYRNRRIIAQEPRDDLLISLHRSGTGAVRQHGREAKLRPGMAALYDAAAPYTLAFEADMSEIVLQLPRGALRLPQSALHDLTARPLPLGAPLRALTTLATEVCQPSRAGSALENATVADAMISLLTAVVAADPARAAPTDAGVLVFVVQRYIDERTSDPHLTPAAVARAHRISLRLLQKLFASQDDSPAAYIRRRRMRQARNLLLAGFGVAAAGRATGMLDPDTFRRAFQREFGIAPSAMRDAAVGNTGWLRERAPLFPSGLETGCGPAGK